MNEGEFHYISDDEDSLFYKVPGRILSFIDGCPSKVTQIEMKTNADDEQIFFSTQIAFVDKKE